MINLTKPFYFLFTIYIAAIIVFKQNFIAITYMIDALLIGLFIFYIIGGHKNVKFNLLIITYTLFSIFALVSSFWAISFDTASFKSLQLFLIVVNLIVLYNLMINFNLSNAFVHGILIGSFVNYVLIMDIIPVPFDTKISWRYMGTTGNPNALAITMLVSMFLSIVYLMDKKRKKNWLFYYQYINLLFAMYTILLTVSKKGIILGVGLLLFYMVISLKNKKGIVRIVVLVILASVVFHFFVDDKQINEYFTHTINRFIKFSDQLEGSVARFSSTGYRKRLIEFGLMIFQDKPLFGYGLNNFRFLSEKGLYAHNNFVELLVGVGLIGFGLFYYIYAYLLTLIHKMPKSELRTLIVFFILILIVMDMALVSYGSKLTIYLLLFLSVFISQNINWESLKHER